MRKQIAKAMVIAGVVLGLVACTTTRQPTQSQPVKPPQKIVELINGIPIYPGFSYQEDKSFVYESTEVKAGVLVFSGKATMSQLVDFYRSKMPEYGWKMVSFFQHDQDSFLNYDAPDRTCQLTLHVGDFSSTITIRTGTKLSTSNGPSSTDSAEEGHYRGSSQPTPNAVSHPVH